MYLEDNFVTKVIHGPFAPFLFYLPHLTKFHLFGREPGAEF